MIVRADMRRADGLEAVEAQKRRGPSIALHTVVEQRMCLVLAEVKAREELLQVCESVGKVLVRLSIGYAPSAVLSAIVNQASDRLGANGAQSAPVSRTSSLTAAAALKSSAAARRSAASGFAQGFEVDEDDID